MAPNYPRIGFAIRQARLAKKLSQDELAQRVGARGGRHTVIRWEHGLHRPTEFAEALCRELGLDPALFDEDEDADVPLSRGEATQLVSLLGKALGVQS